MGFDAESFAFWSSILSGALIVLLLLLLSMWQKMRAKRNLLFLGAFLFAVNQIQEAKNQSYENQSC
jgi:hypothetical protein